MSATPLSKPSLNVFLCAPRGFCAGVVRAIDIVEHALRKYRRAGLCAPRNRAQPLCRRGPQRKGAIFVEELDEVPDDGAPVVFSPMACRNPCRPRPKAANLMAIDATCPLVTKVHREAEIHFRRGRKVVLVGHRGHTEVIGTMGQLPEGAVVLVESPEDVGSLPFAADEPKIAMSRRPRSRCDDIAEMVNALKERYPRSRGRTSRTSATPPPIARKRSRKSPTRWTPRGRLAQFVQFAAPRRKWPSATAARSHPAGAARDRHRLVATSKAPRRSASPPEPPAPEVLVEEILDAVAEKLDLVVDTVTTATEDMSCPLRALPQRSPDRPRTPDVHRGKNRHDRRGPSPRRRPPQP